jgi:hypothetical protein
MVVFNYNHTSRIRTFATAFFPTQSGFSYYYAMVLEDDRKSIRVYDFLAQNLAFQIHYSGDIDA